MTPQSASPQPTVKSPDEHNIPNVIHVETKVTDHTKAVIEDKVSKKPERDVSMQPERGVKLAATEVSGMRPAEKSLPSTSGGSAGTSQASTKAAAVSNKVKVCLLISI